MRRTGVGTRRREAWPQGVILALIAAVLLPASVLAVDGGKYASEANEDRTAYGVRPLLDYSSISETAADERARYMASTNNFTHDLAPLTRRLQAAGICYSGAGEIIAYNARRDVAYTMAQWMASDGHRKIILNSAYDRAAGSWADASNGRRYHVMYFYDPCNSPAPSSLTQIQVSFRSPTNGQVVSGGVVWQASVSATAASRVEFFVDGSLRWTERYSPYVFNGDGARWDTTRESEGAHTLKLRAVATNGTVATASIQVTVDNR